MNTDVLVFKGEPFMLVDDEFIPVKEINKKIKELIDNTPDDIVKLFLINSSIEQLIDAGVLKDI